MIRTIEDGEIVPEAGAALSAALGLRITAHQVRTREKFTPAHVAADGAEFRRLIKSARWNLRWSRSFTH